MHLIPFLLIWDNFLNNLNLNHTFFLYSSYILAGVWLYYANAPYCTYWSVGRDMATAS